MSLPEGSVRDRIVAEIRESGPVGFDRFMEMALYDPDGGYFASGALRSERSGDFLTSPEVSRHFGATLARFVQSEFDRIGEPFSLTEVGGGSGTLLRPLLDELGWLPRVAAAERSAAARQAIAARVPEATVDIEATLQRGVLIGNEVLDNLPAALVIRRGSRWAEVRVDAQDDRLVMVESPTRLEVAVWADRYAGQVPEGGRVEVQLEATQFVSRRVEGLIAGAVVLIDYGDLVAGLESRRAEGTIRTYQGHHLGPDPLELPGTTDITMDVNFSAVIAAAESAGAAVEFMSQRAWLESLGLRERIDSLRTEELNAARAGRSTDRLVLKSDITGAEALLHPRGLGDFRVLVARK